MSFDKWEEAFPFIKKTVLTQSFTMWNHREEQYRPRRQ